MTLEYVNTLVSPQIVTLCKFTHDLSCYIYHLQDLQLDYTDGLREGDESRMTLGLWSLWEKGCEVSIMKGWMGRVRFRMDCDLAGCKV